MGVFAICAAGYRIDGGVFLWQPCFSHVSHWSAFFFVLSLFVPGFLKWFSLCAAFPIFSLSAKVPSGIAYLWLLPNAAGDEVITKFTRQSSIDWDGKEKTDCINKCVLGPDLGSRVSACIAPTSPAMATLPFFWQDRHFNVDSFYVMQMEELWWVMKE